MQIFGVGEWIGAVGVGAYGQAE
jgi:hypothetical protein